MASTSTDPYAVPPQQTPAEAKAAEHKKKMALLADIRQTALFPHVAAAIAAQSQHQAVAVIFAREIGTVFVLATPAELWTLLPKDMASTMQQLCDVTVLPFRLQEEVSLLRNLLEQSFKCVNKGCAVSPEDSNVDERSNDSGSGGSKRLKTV